MGIYIFLIISGTYSGMCVSRGEQHVPGNVLFLEEVLRYQIT